MRANRRRVDKIDRHSSQLSAKLRMIGYLGLFIRDIRGNPISFVHYRLAAGLARRAEDALY